MDSGRRDVAADGGGRHTLSILHLEDSPDDACLIGEILMTSGVDCRITVVSSRDEFLNALGQDTFDLILSDYGIPGFNGLAALRTVRGSGSEIPFLFVTGTLGEEVAIESLRNGATDYVLKDRLTRLAPAVMRAAEEAEVRRGRARAERTLREEQLFLKAMLESLDAGVIACNADGVVTLVNGAARNAHPEPMEPRPLEEIVERYNLCRADGRTPLDRDELPLARALAGEHVRDAEITVGPQGGPMRTFLVSGQPIVDPGDRRIGAVVALHDITERKSLEQQFLQAQKMEAVGQLAAGIAHDFNNLLSVISAYTELAMTELDRGADPAGYRDCLEEVGAAARRAATLTRQLLTFSRRQIVEPRLVDLNEVLEEMDKMLRHLIGAGIAFDTRPGAGIGSVMVDPGQIEQVVMNLVVNARDAMPRGGSVTIETSCVTFEAPRTVGGASLPSGACTVLSVSDTGSGIDAQTVDRIFEPFFTTKGVGKGTGLGLATVYGIVKNHHGAIELDTEPGRGTTFRIYLPCVESARGRATPAASAPPGRGSETILVVEDERALREMVLRCLREFGYTAIGAGDVREAERVIEERAEDIDLVVSDVILPGEDGRSFVERLRARQPGIRTLLVSGYCGESVAPEGPAAARVPFLQKPFTLSQLGRTIREILDAARQEAA